MPETVRFRSRIEAARAGTATGGGAAAKIPDELVKPLGGLKQMRMDATLNGIAFKTSTMPYRGGFYVGVHKAIREQAGVGIGDEVEMQLTRDESPRVLELAPDLEAALATDPELRARFDAMSFTRRKEMSEPIRTAVKPETRAARLEKALETLRTG
jgi:uncharacterized protein YdeI (YjbR/CyaY-like superfamily)